MSNVQVNGQRLPKPVRVWYTGWTYHATVASRTALGAHTIRNGYAVTYDPEAAEDNGTAVSGQGTFFAKGHGARGNVCRPTTGVLNQGAGIICNLPGNGKALSALEGCWVDIIPFKSGEPIEVSAFTKANMTANTTILALANSEFSLAAATTSGQTIDGAADVAEEFALTVARALETANTSSTAANKRVSLIP